MHPSTRAEGGPARPLPPSPHGEHQPSGLTRAPDASIYLTKLFNCSYPEGNFGGNQLLDGSPRLSPLYPGMTNDLHCNIATSLHQSFAWLHPAQALFTRPVSEGRSGGAMRRGVRR